MLLLLFGWEVSVLFPFTRSNTAMKQKKSKMYMLLASYALQDAKRVESRKNVRQQRFRHIR